MKTNLRIAVSTAFFFLLCMSVAHAQNFSNMGKDFWIGYGNHVRMINNGIPEKMQLYITSDVATSGSVNIPGIGFSQSYSVTANQITTIDIPRNAALVGDGQYNLGIHVTAEKPVVVYSFIFINAISGATVCLPTNTLGKEYFSVNYEQTSNESNSHSYFFVVAADTGKTTVEITPSAATKGGRAAGVPFLVTLQQGEIYQVLGTTTGNFGVDLTGSKIRSVNTGTGCKKIAVYSGSGKISIGCTGPRTSDNLYQQMYPTSTWGKKYITVPTLINSFNFFRIMKSDPSAIVRVNGTVIPDNLFIKNFYYTLGDNQPSVIESDKPILVAQYLTSQACSGNNEPGDPDMIFLNPVEQTIAQVTLNSMQPANVNIDRHFLNVVLKNTPSAINSFRLDGVPFTAFTPVPTDNEYAFARIQTTAGTHSLTCDTGFNVIAYGFGSAESYGYSGGTNLKDLYQFVSVKNQFATPDFPATCAGAPIQLGMTFPYQPLKIRWLFNGLFPDEVINAPVADSTWVVNGRQLYRYKLTRQYTAPTPGIYPIRIMATNGSIDGCTGEQEIDFELNVYAAPRARFRWDSRACLNDTIKFIEQYTGNNNRPAAKWLWNFGSADTSMRANPAYLYPAAGTYNVTFALVNDLGCLSDTATTQLVIHPLPQNNISTAGPYCQAQEIVLRPNATVATGSITSWKWTLGNNTLLNRTDSQPFTHRFNNTGNYKVVLETTTDKGCVHTAAEKNLLIYPVPVAGFTLPENCLSDPFSQFTDTSTIADGSQAQFSYAWQFGDAASGTANTSNLKNPTHKYSLTGNYKVTQVVTSQNGCADTTTQELTINGSQPVATFSIKGGAEQCSNNPITVINNATVDVGKIVRLEWYWDATGDRTKVEVDENPQPGKEYQFTYPEFFSPATHSYTIELVAYSGESCLIASRQTLTLKATPQLSFSELAAVCSNQPSFTLTAAALQNTLPGSGAYTGKGINGSGLFTPSMAGAGTHPIRYTYTGTNGCSNFVEQVLRVNKTPLVNAGPDKVSVKGRPVLLTASTPDNGLSFSWSPATGMNNPALLQPTVTILQDQLFRVTATTAAGCTATDEVWVKTPDRVFVPNSFSPNGDGLNDTWRIPYLDPEEKAEVRVYNRDGVVVYQCTGCWVEWDGRFKGIPQPAGTYVYLVDFKKAYMPVLKGTITLVR